MYKAWLYWICGASFYFFQFIGRTAPSIMSKDIMVDFSVSATELSLLTSSWYWGYAIMQIPVGILLDKIGPKKILAVASLICTISCIVFAISENFALSVFSRFVLGVGSSCGFIGSFKLAAILFPERYLPFIAGITSAIGTGAAVCVGIPISYWTEIIGWRSVFFLLAGLGLLVFLLITRVLKVNYIKEEKTDLSGIFTNKSLWLIGFYGMAIYSPISVLADFWGVNFLENVHSMSKLEASSLNTLISAGFAVGGCIVGLVYNLFKRENIFFFLVGIFTSILIYFVIWTNINLCMLLFLLGLIGSGECMIFSSAVSRVRTSAAGATSGFINMFTMLGGSIFQPLVGFTMDSQWTGATNNGLRIYETNSYKYSMSVILVILITSAILGLFIRKSNYGRA
jgi:predicted MFS family arabinose efflux permease